MPMHHVAKSSPLSRQDFHAQLRTWLSTGENRIDGQADGYGNSPLVYVRDGSKVFRLNRDTKRQGVEEYLMLVARYGTGIEWTIVANQNESKPKNNAVRYGPDQSPVKRFYLYLA